MHAHEPEPVLARVGGGRPTTTPHHDHDHAHATATGTTARPGRRAGPARAASSGTATVPASGTPTSCHPDVPPFSRRGIVMLATSGGLVPSPSAVLVVVSAFSLGRVGLGLSLVGAFSLGLAGTLTAIGLSLVFGRGFVERHWGRSLEVLPVIGAVRWCCSASPSRRVATWRADRRVP